MEQSQKLIECDACKQSFDVKSIEIYPRIVKKERLVAIAYCFRCPECGHEYMCYFKDSQVNAFLRKGQEEKAKQRMILLREIFLNDYPV